jgi:hypothetical protein
VGDGVDDGVRERMRGSERAAEAAGGADEHTDNFRQISHAVGMFLWRRRNSGPEEGGRRTGMRRKVGSHRR